MADYGLLSGIAEGAKGFFQGRNDAEDRSYKRMEIAARLKAQDESDKRQKFLDSLTLKEKGYEVPQGDIYSSPLERSTERNPKELEDIRMKFQLTGQEPQFDESGRLVGAQYRPDYLALKEKVAKAQDPLDVAIKQARLKRLQSDIRGSTPNGEARSGKMLAADKVLQVQEGAQVPRMLEDISTTLDVQKDLFGPVQGRIAANNPYNKSAQTVDAQLRSAAQSFGRYMEGGVLRKEDEEKYRKMFPNLTDTPDVAKNKLLIVRKLLSDKYNNDIGALSRQGYDVGGFSPIESIDLPQELTGLIPQGLVKEKSGLIKKEAAPAAAPSGLKVGTEEDGYVYVGGDPSDPKSWKKK